MEKLNKTKVFISTIPFASVSKEPLLLLQSMGFEIQINPTGRKLVSNEVEHFIIDCDYYIAGTEDIPPESLVKSKKLKFIGRVGVGYDNVPLVAAENQGITVSYTPDAPTDAVAELTLGLMLDLCRNITLVDKDMRKNTWNKHMGTLLQKKTIGIFGTGRIGKKVTHLLQPFGVKILAFDIRPDFIWARENEVTYVSENELFKNSDILTLHCSYSSDLYHYFKKEKFNEFKTGCFLINTARGKLINEEDLKEALDGNKLAGAALDVFEHEPYNGPLVTQKNVILTAHIGAATIESRARMELEAVQELIRFHKKSPLLNQLV